MAPPMAPLGRPGGDGTWRSTQVPAAHGILWHARAMQGRLVNP